MTYSLKTYRFGTVKDGKLDYGVYEVSSSAEDAPGVTLPEIQLLFAVKGQKFSVWKTCCQLFVSIPEKLKRKMEFEYGKMLTDQSPSRRIDLIAVEFDDMMFVRYCRLGQWFSFAEKSKLGFSDQTAYGNKRNYFGVWDGSKWRDPASYDRPLLSPAEDFEACDAEGDLLVRQLVRRSCAATRPAAFVLGEDLI